jgi:hypothetical protein
MTPYEWWCPRCQVTYPPGTRVCIHCGGLVGPERGPRPGRREGIVSRGWPELPGAPPDDRDEEDTPAGATLRPLRLGMTVLWLVLLAAVTVLRLCHGGPPGG